MTTTTTTTTTVGDLIAAFYTEFLNAYGDKALAERCTKVLVDRLLQGVSI